jgi:nicotinamide-nucleotide amidase
LKSEIISVGTELLLGEIVDTNAAYISQRMAELGLDVHHRQTLGDNHQRLTTAIQTALSRAEVVILIGGLGPTEDDLTREAISAATGRPLVRVPESELRLREFFAARNRAVAESNLKQCEVPTGGRHLENTCGTAPGVFLEHEGKLIFALPGPPPEFKAMTQRSVLPLLRDRLGPAHVLYSRSLLLTEIGESQVADMLGDLIAAQTDPTIAMYASPALVRVRLATKAASQAEAERKFAPLETRIREILGPHVLGADEETMPVVVGRLLRERGAMLAVAESCTGGLIASRLTDVPGASGYFVTGVVAYANETKQRLLGVSEETLRTHGAVSEPCVREMAAGVRTINGATYGLATTGIAGPAGGTPDKPVGLVFVAVADDQGTVVIEQTWPSTREQFKARVSELALGLLRKRVLQGMRAEG